VFDDVEPAAAAWRDQVGVVGDESRTVLDNWFRGPRRIRDIDDWSDDPVTDAVRALLPAWVRWNGEQAGVPASLLERAVGAASTRT
jgi:hypothetical protein